MTTACAIVISHRPVCIRTATRAERWGPEKLGGATASSIFWNRSASSAGHSRGGLLVLQSLLSKPDLFQARFMFSAPLMRDKQRLIADTRKFFRENPAKKSFLYCNFVGQAILPAAAFQAALQGFSEILAE